MTWMWSISYMKESFKQENGWKKDELSIWEDSQTWGIVAATVFVTQFNHFLGLDSNGDGGFGL